MLVKTHMETEILPQMVLHGVIYWPSIDNTGRWTLEKVLRHITKC